MNIERGNPNILGTTLTDEGINFSVMSHNATACTLLLFDLKALEAKGGGVAVGDAFASIQIPESCRFGDTFSVLVKGLGVYSAGKKDSGALTFAGPGTNTLEDTGYGYIMDGPWAPEHGHRFNNTNILVDPYAKLFWRAADGHQYLGRIVKGEFDWSGDVHIGRPMNELVIYELNVRTFNVGSCNNVTDNGVRCGGVFAGGGTFNSVKEKIPYFKELGINALEFLPIFEYNENGCRFNAPDGTPLKNVWGYDSIGYFAPKAFYCAAEGLEDKFAEFKTLVKELHTNGMEVILDVVYNHSPEYDQSGETISYRGLDNSSYYILSPGGGYVDFTGCHNTLNAGSQFVRRMVLESLRYWVREFHIDGFRFDLASVFNRNGYGPDGKSLVQLISEDSELAGIKLIAEPWDAAGMYELGRFGGDSSFTNHGGGVSGQESSQSRWSEWNGRYRDALRRFVKGDAGARWDVKESLCGSPDLYAAAGRGAAASINFITAHDGFTLMDLVSYNSKHNEANGEGGRDGSDQNFSWNCGYEGVGNSVPDDLKNLRIRQIKNFITLLMVSRGVPMILAGDEMGRTQRGNNNAWCQENEISFIDWSLLENDFGSYAGCDSHSTSSQKEKNSTPESCVPYNCNPIYRHFKDMIAFRKAHPILSGAEHYKYCNCGVDGYPDLSWHGERAWDEGANHCGLTLGMLISGKEVVKDAENVEHPRICDYGENCGAPERETFIYVAMNFHWEAHNFELPQLPEGYVWRINVNTYLDSADAPSASATSANLADSSSCGSSSYDSSSVSSDNLREVLVGERSVIVFSATKPPTFVAK